MGQQEVYTLLEKHKDEWLSSRDIYSKLKASSGSVITSLHKLRKSKTVNFKMAKLGKTSNREVYVYRFKQ